MRFTVDTMLLAAGLLLGMLAMMEVGRRVGRRRGGPSAPIAGSGALEAAVFGFMGLLVAFSFSGAAARFDARRALVVEEANDIGTAYLRLDLLPAELQPPLRESFRRYLDLRLENYRDYTDADGLQRAQAQVLTLQRQIWQQAVAACRSADSAATTTLLLDAINQMFDVTTTRTMAARMHPPMIIFVMLFGLALTSALLAGRAMAAHPERSHLHSIGFAAITALAVYVILDLESPRRGLIRVDDFDQVLVDLRGEMN